MFEREIRDLAFIHRWGIVRTIRDQSVSEHTYNVAMYANDIASYLSLETNLHLQLLQMTLWHDMDEIFTGDLPGPGKHALMQKKDVWKETISKWMHKVFSIHEHRTGAGLSAERHNIAVTILKVADELDAACEMAAEVSMGNHNCRNLIGARVISMLKHYDALVKLVDLDEQRATKLEQRLKGAVENVEKGHQLAPIVISQ